MGYDGPERLPVPGRDVAIVQCGSALGLGQYSNSSPLSLWVANGPLIQCVRPASLADSVAAATRHTNSHTGVE